MSGCVTFSRHRTGEYRKSGIHAALMALVAACPFGCPMDSTAANEAITLTIENDVFTGSDNNYTNGFGLTWVSRGLETYGDKSFLKKWGDFWSFLPFVSDQGYTTYASWSLVQEMHTPDDIDVPNPPLDDQPYAGILYVDSVLYATNARWMHAWELKLGVVGPASHADDVQTEFHKAFGADEPQGWDTQLPDEPVINVGYTAAYRLAAGNLGKTASWRVVPLATAGFGTYFTGVGLGMYGEVGWNLVDALGGASLRSGLNAASTVGVGPVKGWSLSLWGGFGGYGVAQYLPLDGTVFRDSRSVDTEPLIGTATVGISVRRGAFALSYSQTYFTKTFETERESPSFGTLSVSWVF